MIAMVLSIGAVFGVFASIMAFLITYEEYMHHYIGKREPLIASFQTALFTFFVFVGLALLVGWLFSNGSLVH
jgi:hypothetical protein